MNEPIISYSAKISTNSTYKDDVNELYGGTYTNTNPIKIDIRIWNNRYGLEDVRDLENFYIKLQFGSFEDSSLLNYVKLSHKGIADLSMNTRDNCRIGTFLDNDVVIKGTKNNGTDLDKNNYVDLELLFEIDDENVFLKYQDLKELYLEIVES